MILHVDVVNKIATFQKRGGCIVCGNSDYQIKFSFDAEWNEYTTKTARFIWGGHYTDVDFTGDSCDVPTIYDTAEVEVGVYAGDLKTTTSARIDCQKSILCKGGTPSEENDRAHANEAKEAADRAEAAAKVAEEYAGKIIIEGGGISAEVERRLTDLEADVDELQKNGSISEEVEKQLTDLEAAIDAINATLNYEKIYFKSFSMEEPSTTEFEYGDSVPIVKFKWELSKPAKSIKVNGKTLEDPTVTEYEAKGPFTSDQSWTVVATDEKGGEATATKEIKFYYESIKFKSFTMEPSDTEYEHGVAVASVKLKWQLNRDATKITVNGKPLEDTTATEYEAPNGPFTTDQEWEVVVTGAKGETAKKTAKIDFKFYRVYWGVGMQASGFDDDFVTKLQNSEKVSSRSKTFTVTPNAQYIYYAVPEDLCEPDEHPTFVIDNGFPGGFYYVERGIVVEKAVSIPYRVYRSDQQLVGSTRIVIT